MMTHLSCRRFLTLHLPGARIDTASSAQEALALFQQHDYDTLISDVQMPGMDGLELLAQISAVQPDTSTMLITGHGDPTLLTQALRAGAYDFIADLQARARCLCREWRAEVA